MRVNVSVGILTLYDINYISCTKITQQDHKIVVITKTNKEKQITLHKRVMCILDFYA